MSDTESKNNNIDKEMTEAEKKAYHIIGEMLEITNIKDLIDLIAAIQNGKYKYFITLDMGCGNTSAAVSRIDDYDSCILLGWEYLEQNFDTGLVRKLYELSIPTILGYDDDEPIIGPEGMMYGEIVENFKVIPTPENLVTLYAQVGDFTDVPLRRIWKRYFEKAFMYALEDAQRRFDDINRENVILVVARPADNDWKANLDTYKNLIMDGTKLKREQIVTFSEAKASMQFVRVEKKLALNWEKGVLVIDLGASTIDIEYLIYGKEPKEWSITMAGKEVDYLLGNAVLSQIYPDELKHLKPNEFPDEEFFKERKNELGNLTKRRFAWRMRKLKEDICTFNTDRSYKYNTKSGEKKEVHIDKAFLKKILATEQFTFNCCDPSIAAYMNGQAEDEKVKLSVMGTWYKHFEKLVSCVLTEIGKKGKYVDTIIVTGGTVNLIGIEDCVKQGIRTAGWPELKVVVLNQRTDYERTVPYGSSSYLTNVIEHMPRILSFPKKCRAMLRYELVSNTTRIITDKLTSIVVKEVHNVINFWAKRPAGDPLSSVDSLKSEINKIVLSDSQINACIEEIGKKIDSVQMTKTVDICNKFLNELSISQKYTHPIAVNRVQYKLDPLVVNGAVKESFASLSLTKYLTGFFNRLFGMFTDDDKPLKLSARQSIANNFLLQNTVYDDLLHPIEDLLFNAFDSSMGFGIVESIMEDLEMDINQSMFIG